MPNILAVDIGGTKTTIAVCDVSKSNVEVRTIHRFATPTLKSLEFEVEQVIRKEGKVAKIGIAAAGHVSEDRKICQLTNSHIKVDVKKFRIPAIILNDFEALGYSINVLKPKDVHVVRKGVPQGNSLALLGAGTGLGKAMLINDGSKYVPCPSEGGHSDLPILPGEVEVFKWLQRSRKIPDYESVLSGEGIRSLYAYSCQTKQNTGASSAAEIMQENSRAAKFAKDLFIKFYARCAKNFALDVLSQAGVIIGGGIAAKNPKLFGKDFIAEFERNEKQKALLEKMPIKIIKNEDAGILGAAYASYALL